MSSVLRNLMGFSMHMWPSRICYLSTHFFGFTLSLHWSLVKELYGFWETGSSGIDRKMEKG